MKRFDIAREVSTGKKVAIQGIAQAAPEIRYYVRDVNTLGIRVGDTREVGVEELEEWSDSITPARGTTPA